MLWTLTLLPFILATAQAAQPCGHVADVAFVIDSSRSIWIYDFIKQKEFVQTIVRQFVVGPNDIHVAALTFSRNVVHQFHFDQFDNADDIIEKIGNIEHDAGDATYTNDALLSVKTELFSTAHGARSGVEQICIVLTDGESTNKNATLFQAADMKARGIKILAVGIGDINDEELKQMVSSPAEDTYFNVDTFNELEDARFQQLVAEKACEQAVTTPTPKPSTPKPKTPKPSPPKPKTPTPTTPKSTTSTEMQKDEPKPDCQGKEVDIVFIIDSSSSIWPIHYEEQLSFLTKLVGYFDVDSGKTQIAMIKFSTEAEVLFYLNEYKLASDMSSTILASKTSGGSTNTHLALQLLLDDVLTPEKGMRPGVAHIGILITDGISRKPQELKLQAKRVHDSGTYMFAIGVGNVTDMSELETLASKPSADYAIEVNGYLALNKIKDILAYQACKVPSDQKRCAEEVKADIMFGLYGIGGTDRSLVGAFITKIGIAFGLSSGNVRIGVREQCGDASFGLTEFADGGEYKAVVQETMSRSMSSLLYSMRMAYGMSSSGVKRVAVVVMSGDVEDMDAAYKEALRMKFNTRVIIVGVGKGTDSKVMARLASSKNKYDPDSTHVFAAQNAEDLTNYVSKLLRLVCVEQ